MTETNIRIVSPGYGLFLETRCADVNGQNLSPDLLQKVCNALQGRQGLAAVPSGRPGQLLVATCQPVPSLVLQGRDWRVEVKDSGRTNRLEFSEQKDAPRLAQLLERCCLIQIGFRTRMWKLRSPRIWYEEKAFAKVRGIAAYRCFQVSAIPIDSIGVGISVGVATAFFTDATVDTFFRDGLPEPERAKLRQRFQALSDRQKGQKGTLLYDTGRSRHVCYFAEFLSGMTCATTGKIRVHGRDYQSLLVYYQDRYPRLPVAGNDPVARVSFRGIDRPVLVAAKRLRLRVPNSALPQELKQVDKIAPCERGTLADTFWAMLGKDPLGQGKPPVANHFWQPTHDRVMILRPPDLLFPGGHVVSAPANGKLREHRHYFRQRKTLLQQVGCLSVPPAVHRVISVPVPKSVGEQAGARLASDVVENLSRWTRKRITAEVLPYDTLQEALSRFGQAAQPGVTLFVFDDEDPAAYFTVAYELKAWRVKRVTSLLLQKRYRALRLAEHSVCDQQDHPDIRAWRSFVELTALDVLQQLDCVPWGLAADQHFQAQLAIDVGWDRRHFALSLLICRPHSDVSPLWLETVVRAKSDPKAETINETILRDEIVSIYRRAARRWQFTALASNLVLRDGRESGHELDAILAATSELTNLGLLANGAKVDVVDFHKSSLKGVRLWSRNNGGRIENETAGKAVFLDKKTVVLTTTGAPWLRQGTAEPIFLVARSPDVDMAIVASAVYAATQLNWSSPDVPQRLPIELKRADDELENRIAQEVRRIL